jgi:branched-chain amino acid transport system permease protein
VLPRSLQVLVALGLVALLACPFVTTDFYAQMVARMMILAIFAMSLDLLQGVTGLVSLGHAAFFGIGGYALSLPRPPAPVSLWWTLPLPCWPSAAFALVIGFFVVRTQGIYFIMVTMAFAQMLFYLVFDNKDLRIGGRCDGRLSTSTSSRTPGVRPREQDRLLLLHARLPGAGLRVPAPAAVEPVRPRAGRHPRQRAPHARAGLRHLRLQARRPSRSPARWPGLAGYLWGAQTGFVNPELMGFHMSAHAIMMVILGGMGNFAGAIAGAFAFEYLLHVFKDLPAIGTSTPASTGSCGSACSSCCGGLRAARPAGRGRRLLRRKEAP